MNYEYRNCPSYRKCPTCFDKISKGLSSVRVIEDGKNIDKYYHTKCFEQYSGINIYEVIG